MYLNDLYRYHTTPGRDQLEGFLTTALAALLHADDDLRARLLQQFGRRTAGVQVEHQRRFTKNGSTCIADIHIATDDGGLILEAKVGDSPKISQIRTYRDVVPEAVVVLLAPEHKVTKLAGHPDWNQVRTLTWQGLHDLADPATTDKPQDQWLRKSFRDFLAHKNLAPPLAIDPERIDELQLHWNRIGSLQVDLAAAVCALVPAGQTPPDTGAPTSAWDVDALEAWWEKSRADSGTLVRGLGLRADLTLRTTLDWTLCVLPGSTIKGGVLTAHDFELKSFGWWERPLFQGGSAATWEEDLAEAVETARKCLAEIGIRPGRTILRPHEQTTVASALNGAHRALSTNRALWNRGRTLHTALAQRYGVGDRQKWIPVKQAKLNTWFQVDTETLPWLDIWFGLGHERRNLEYRAAIQQWAASQILPPFVAIREYDTGLTSISADLTKSALEPACDALASLVDRIVREVPVPT